MSKRVPTVFTDAEHKALKRAALEADTTMTEYIKAAVAEKIARSANVETAPALPPLPAATAADSGRGVLAEADEKAA